MFYKYKTLRQESKNSNYKIWKKSLHQPEQIVMKKSFLQVIKIDAECKIKAQKTVILPEALCSKECLSIFSEKKRIGCVG